MKLLKKIFRYIKLLPKLLKAKYYTKKANKELQNNNLIKALSKKWEKTELINSSKVTYNYISITSVKQSPIEKKEYHLSQNYPNPFNPTTTISYSIPERTNVKLEIFDPLGRKISTLVNENKSPGNYQVEFNAENLQSGLYIYRIVTDIFTDSKKLLLLK